MSEQTPNKKRKRPGNWTGSIDADLQIFAKERAKELNLSGGASELMSRLLVAEATHKISIANKNPKNLPRALRASCINAQAEVAQQPGVT